MNNKKVKLIVIVIIVVVVFGTLGFCLYLKYQNGNHIPDDYIAVVNSGVGEITYSTYIYKIDNGNDNYGFKYINTTNETSSWGSSEVKTKITGKGKVNWIADIFDIEKNNSGYSYIRLPNDNKIYSVEEFIMMFPRD